jgi:hypothetical protein
MTLNLPIIDAISDCKAVLIAGMGGGFDVFCGLPVYFELKRLGKKVHLASYSFSDIIDYKEGIILSETLKGVGKGRCSYVTYFPELHLANWFDELLNERIPIWCFQKTGTRPLLENYKILQRYLGIDCIILVDGGVDSLIRGDEPGTGTLIEDATSLFVVNELREVPVKIVGCIGIGVEPDLTYYHIFENIARLTEAGGFLGSCSLAPGMETYKLYEDAVSYAQGMRFQDPSVVNSSIVSAVQGHYGDYHLTTKTQGSRLWISPLMALYWFFDLPIVAEFNLYLSNLKDTDTFIEALMSYMTFSETLRRRHPQGIPLP